MESSFILLDDIGSVVNVALFAGAIVALVSGVFVFSRAKQKRTYKIIVSAIAGVLLFMLVVWLILNFIGHF